MEKQAEKLARACARAIDAMNEMTLGRPDMLAAWGFLQDELEAEGVFELVSKAEV